jgi:hypothetical protein
MAENIWREGYRDEAGQEAKSLCILTLRTLPTTVLEKDAVGAFLFDHLPSAFRLPQEAHQALHSPCG